MGAMSQQVREHLASVQANQAELRALNEDLAASEEKYRSIVDHAPFGIFSTSGMTVTFSNRYNRAPCRFESRRQQRAGCLPAVDPSGRPRPGAHGICASRRQDRPYETVFRFLHGDGSVRKVLSRRIPIRNKEGQTTMYQGFNIDITALDDMQQQLSRAERLATLGQVAAGIAHEIRNPLVGIGSTAALLRDEFDPSDEKRADLDIILNETRRLDRIVNQIIDYARPRDLVPTTWAVDGIVDEVLKLLDTRLETQRITIIRSCRAGAGCLCGSGPDQTGPAELVSQLAGCHAIRRRTADQRRTRGPRRHMPASLSRCPTPAPALRRRTWPRSFNRFSRPESNMEPDWD